MTSSTGLLTGQLRPQDPFNVVKEYVLISRFFVFNRDVILLVSLFNLLYREVEQAVNAISTLFNQWRQILEESPNSPDYFATTKDIKESIKAVEWDIQCVYFLPKCFSIKQRFRRNS